MRKPAMTRRMICNSAQSRSGWVANRMREPNRKREHALAHRHTRDHAVDQVGSALRHAPRPHEGQNPRRLPENGESYQLLMAALTTARTQKTLGEDNRIRER